MNVDGAGEGTGILLPNVEDTGHELVHVGSGRASLWEGGGEVPGPAGLTPGHRANVGRLISIHLVQ